MPAEGNALNLSFQAVWADIKSREKQFSASTTLAGTQARVCIDTRIRGPVLGRIHTGHRPSPNLYENELRHNELGREALKRNTHLRADRHAVASLSDQVPHHP